jgi:hypothetical protein
MLIDSEKVVGLFLRLRILMLIYQGMKAVEGSWRSFIQNGRR